MRATRVGRWMVPGQQGRGDKTPPHTEMVNSALPPLSSFYSLFFLCVCVCYCVLMCYGSAPRGRSPSPPVLLCLGSRKVPGSCHQVENGKFSPPYLGSLCPALLSPRPVSRCSLSELPNAFFFFFPSAKESLPSPRRDPAALWTRRRFSVVGFLGSWDGICLPWSSHRVGKGETRESPQSSKKKKTKTQESVGFSGREMFETYPLHH